MSGGKMLIRTPLSRCQKLLFFLAMMPPASGVGTVNVGPLGHMSGGEIVEMLVELCVVSKK